MSNIKGGELPKKRELTVEDLFAEINGADRTQEEKDLNAPILAEQTAGVVAKITQPDTVAENTVPKSFDETKMEKGFRLTANWGADGKSYTLGVDFHDPSFAGLEDVEYARLLEVKDCPMQPVADQMVCFKNIQFLKDNILSIVTNTGLNFYAYDPVAQKILPIDGLQGVAHQISKRVDMNSIFTDYPFVIEYADVKKGRWVSVFDIASKKVTPLIKMEVSGKIEFKGDSIKVQRNGKEDMYFFYKDEFFYEFDTKEYLGYGSLFSGLMRIVTGNIEEKKPIPHDFETARKYLKPVEKTPVIIK